MFFDVKYRFKQKASDEIQEKVVRIENAKGGAATMRDLAMACYKVFARRDIEIVSCEAIMYVPKLMSVEVNDEGLVTIDGRPIDPSSDVMESEMASSMFASISASSVGFSRDSQVTDRSNKQIEAHVEKQEAQVQSQPSDVRKEIELGKEERLKLDVGERRWRPSPSEAAQGYSMITTYDPPKNMLFDPPGDPESYALPIAYRSRHVIREKIFRKGSRDGFFRIDLPDGHIMLPEMLFVDAPLQQDPMLDVQASRPNTQTVVNNGPGDKEAILDRVPLQRSDDRRPSSRVPTIGPDGIVHGLENNDIRAGRRR